MKKRLTALLCCILAACTVFGGAAVASSSAAGDPVPAAETVAGETRLKSNLNGNSYNRYNTVVRNYLVPVDGGCMRLYGSDDGTLLAEYYDDDFRFVGNRIVEAGLPLFGGFYEYNGCYYVLTGDENPDEDDSREVFRITCFDKDWQEQGYDAIYGANTTLPFSAGRASFAGYGDVIVIRTCHRVYEIDGVNHQMNMTIVFDAKRCIVKDYFCDIASIKSAGYLAHSFNQFVSIDTNGRVVCLDHGDAHPREAALGRFTTAADSLVIHKSGYQTYQYTPIISYYGELGDNKTAAMVGGLAISPTSYLTVGTAAGQDENYRTNVGFNAYLSVTPKNIPDLKDAETKITYLSSFSEEDGRYASNPHLVRISSDLFLVMWNELPAARNLYGYVVDVQIKLDDTCVMKYVFVDGDGEPVSEIRTAPAGQGIFISECEPVVDRDRILWHVTDGGAINAIIEMDLTGKITVHDHLLPEGIVVYPIDLSRATVSLRSFDKIPEDTQITEENLDDYVVVCYRGRPLQRGKDYRLAAVNPIQITASQGTIKRIALKLSTVPNYSYLPLSYTYNWAATDNNLVLNSVYRDTDGVHLNAVARRGAGYHVYRKELGSTGDYEKIGTVSDKLTDYYIDRTASRGKAYTYVIREYTFDQNGAEVLSPASTARTVQAVAGYEPTEPPTDPPTQPTEPSTNPPTQPTEPPTEPPLRPVLSGDADRDGAITILDATAIQRYLAGLCTEDQIDTAAAEVDGDGGVTILDATMIQRYLAGLFTGCRIGELFWPAR